MRTFILGNHNIRKVDEFEDMTFYVLPDALSWLSSRKTDGHEDCLPYVPVWCPPSLPRKFLFIQRLKAYEIVSVSLRVIYTRYR